MHDTVEIPLKVSKFCARLDAGARFCLYRWSSTLSFTVDSSLGVLVPYVDPHDLYHALTYQQNDFQRFGGGEVFSLARFFA